MTTGRLQLSSFHHLAKLIKQRMPSNTGCDCACCHYRRETLHSHKYYVLETHIMYFIRRCWFLKCSEEIHYEPIGAGDMWDYVPVDDGWEEVLGCNVYITSQYFSPNVKYWTASSGNRTRTPPDRMWTIYHWAMESVHKMGMLVIHYVPVLLSKCQILNCIVRESNPGPPW